MSSINLIDEIYSSTSCVSRSKKLQIASNSNLPFNKITSEFRVCSWADGVMNVTEVRSMPINAHTQPPDHSCSNTYNNNTNFGINLSCNQLNERKREREKWRERRNPNRKLSNFPLYWKRRHYFQLHHTLFFVDHCVGLPWNDQTKPTKYKSRLINWFAQIQICFIRSASPLITLPLWTVLQSTFDSNEFDLFNSAQSYTIDRLVRNRKRNTR